MTCTCSMISGICNPCARRAVDEMGVVLEHDADDLPWRTR